MSTIKVVNKITGEVMEWSPSNIEKVIEALCDLKGLKDALERAEKKLKLVADGFLGEEDGFTHPTLNKRLERRIRSPREYNPIKVRDVLGDDDLFMTFVKVSKGDLDKWRSEAVENGELSSDLSNALNEALEYTGKTTSALYFIDA